MNTIHSLIPFNGLLTEPGAKQSQAAGSSFDAFMDLFDTDSAKDAKTSGAADTILSANIFGFGFDSDFDPAKDMIDALFEHMQKALHRRVSAITSLSSASGFAFSPDFATTFGTHGPLIDFINAVTAQRGLTEKQNLALQTIAVNNKDATQSQEWVDKIAKELAEAGIA